MDDLSQRLRFAEGDFLSALETGTLASFHQTWSTVPTTLKAKGTGSDTLSIVNFVASRISNIASCFLDIQRQEELSTSQLQGDCDTMFRQMVVPPTSLCSGTTSTSFPLQTPNAETSSPPLLASAYRWLLGNLHNPYPNAEVKAQIATASSCRISSVSSWFINARRRIGWTTLCREHFSNCRADMLDAAYRALVEEDSQRILSPKVMHSFIAMKGVAEHLYFSTLEGSAFASDLDAAAKDATEEDVGLAGHRGRDRQGPMKALRTFQEEAQGSRVSDSRGSQLARDSYPSPARSPVSAPDESLVDDGKEGDIEPPIIAGSKRRRSSVVLANPQSLVARRPTKRLRPSTASAVHLLSPASSTDSLDDGSQASLVVNAAHPDVGEPVHSPRIHLSGLDSVGLPKNSCDPMADLCLYPGSGSLPRSNTEHSNDHGFDTGFHGLFNIPPAVDATEPDFSALLEVDLFRDYSLTGFLDGMLLPPAGPPTHLSDFESLLQSIGDNTITTAPGHLSRPDITETPYTAPFDPLIPDIPHTDWSSLLNTPDMCQSAIYSTSPQYPIDIHPLTNIDLSMTQSPPVLSTGPEHCSESKQAKLDRLHAMQEAVRRMEQELQSEGVM